VFFHQELKHFRPGRGRDHMVPFFVARLMRVIAELPSYSI
jgi:hypothetical protein